MRIFSVAVRWILASATVACTAYGQTKVDLRTQGRTVDFSAAGMTRPSKTGTQLPATCLTGETFLKTDATPGKNLYICTAANVWTVQGVELPDPGAHANQVLTTDGYSFSWAALSGDVSGRPGAVSVIGLNGHRLGSLTPLDGQYLRWNGAANQWEPVSLSAAFTVFGRSGAVTAQSGDYNFGQISGTAAVAQLPATGGDLSGTLTSASVVRIQSRPVASTAPTAGQVLTWNGTQWSPASPSGAIASIFGRTGAVTAQAGDYTFAQLGGTLSNSQLPSAGGDLGGSLGTAIVTGLQGRSVGSGQPATGNVLTWNGAQWTPSPPTGQVTSTFGRTGAVAAQTGDYTFPQIGGTVAASQLPMTGGDLAGAFTNATVMKLQGRTLSAVQPSTGHILTWDGVQWGPLAPAGVTSAFGRVGAVSAQAGDYGFSQISGVVGASQLPTAAGDLSGPLQAPTVGRIQNRGVSTASPSTGQVLGWDGTQWTPQTVSGAVTSAFGRTGAVTAQAGDYTFAQIGGTVSAGQLPAPGGDLNGTITGVRVTGLQNRPVGTSVPSTGQALVWDGAQWTPQSVSGGVSSVFGRSGAIAAQAGDYSFPQIGGVVSAGQLPAESGDLSGSLASPTVTQLQGRPMATTAPGAGQVLSWNGTQWTPQTPATGGVSSVNGRTGAITSQSGDYTFSQIGGTVANAQLPSAGGDLSGTLGNATVSKLLNRALASTAPSTGQVLAWDGAQWIPQTVSGGNTANMVDKTLANTYSAGAKQTFGASVAASGIGVTPSNLPLVPAAGDIAVDAQDGNKLKVYDGSQWNTLATATNYVATFTGLSSVLVPGSSHKLGTANLVVDCYDSSSPAQRVEPDKVLVDPLTFNVTVSFIGVQTGKCVVTGQSSTGGSGAGAGMSSQLGDLSLVMTAPTVLTAGLNCSPAAPCNTRMGSTVTSVTGSVTLSLSAGTGTAYLYMDSSGLLTVGHNLTLACSAGCTAVSGIAGFPIGSLPLYSWTATNGVWDANGGSDRRAFLSTKNISAGVGMMTLDVGTQTVVAVDSATVPTYLSSTAVLDFASLLPSTCGELTFGLPGAAAGDSIAAGWPGGMEAGLIGTMRVSAAGIVAVRVCNLSASTLDAAAAIYRATVVRNF